MELWITGGESDLGPLNFPFQLESAMFPGPVNRRTVLQWARAAGASDGFNW